MEQDMLGMIISNLPNFIFGGVAIVILYRQNDRLMTLLEKTCMQAQSAALEQVSEKE